MAWWCDALEALGGGAPTVMIGKAERDRIGSDRMPTGQRSIVMLTLLAWRI